MPFEKGMPRPPGAGRKKGTPNKSTVLRIDEALLAEGIEPVSEILKILQSGSLKPVAEVRIWLKLMAFIYPKPRSR